MRRQRDDTTAHKAGGVVAKDVLAVGPAVDRAAEEAEHPMLALDGQCNGGRSVEVGPQIPPEEPPAQARAQPMWEGLPGEPRRPPGVLPVHGRDTDAGNGD